LFWFNIAAIFPTIDFGIPFGPSLWHIDAVNLFTPFTAALVGLGLNEGAYMSEIIRGGILAVDEGQVEAANSVGLSRLKTLRLVVLPQAMRVIIPPTGNEVISMLKTSSLASALAVVELLKAAQNVYASTYEVIPLLIVASIWYLIVTTILSIGQFYIERHFSKGSLRNLPMTPWERIVRDARGVIGKMRTPRGLRGVRP
jgi:polar amino acid transport system permease protein